MKTPTPSHVTEKKPARERSTPLYDIGAEDGMTTDAATANKLPREQQLTRFLQWLQFTDRGHQPC